MRSHAASPPAPDRAPGTNLARLNVLLVALLLQHYQRAVEAYPEDRALWTALAVAHVKAGDLGRAQAVLAEATRAFPDDEETLYLTAEVAERQGRTRDAVATLRRLLAIRP